MYKVKSNKLNVIVNIQYGIGFNLIGGKVEIELSIFNQTQKSRIIDASRNRLNFYEEFIWNIDRAVLKYCRSTNEIVKIECFRIPDTSYGNIYGRQRIGNVIIKLKEFQIIGHDWDQNISVRNYKLQGCSSYYGLRIVLIIQEDTVSDFPGIINNDSRFINKSDDLTKYVKQSIENKKQETKNQQIIRQKNIENRTKENTNKRNINNENKNNVNTNKANTINKGNINNNNTTNNENKNKNTGNAINKGNINSANINKNTGNTINKNINSANINKNTGNTINKGNINSANINKNTGNTINKGNINNANINKNTGNTINKGNINKLKIKDNKMNQINERDENYIKKFGLKSEKGMQEIINKYGNLLNNNQNKEMQYELNSMNKIRDQSIKGSFESLKTYESNDCRLNELLTHCLKHTEKWVKIMKTMKKETDTNVLRSSSNSSIQTESDLEQPVIMKTEFIKILCYIITCMIKKKSMNKTKISQDVINLKNASCILSDFCNEFTNQMRDE